MRFRLFLLIEVEGDSMSPTLRHGDRLLALAPRLRAVRPGRIIAFQRGGALYLKRALAREGGGWFAVGDQPSRSTDSRRFGPVPEPQVEAVALCRLAPFGWL